MKTASLKELKNGLTHQSYDELLQLCLRLTKFKKENKELLTYLLFLSDDEQHFITSVKEGINEQFEGINTKTYYFIKKSVRKIFRNTKRYCRYTKQKETEIELLLHCCAQLKVMRPSIKNNTVLQNIYHREISGIEKKIMALHEDLQYDYTQQIEGLSL